MKKSAVESKNSSNPGNLAASQMPQSLLPTEPLMAEHKFKKSAMLISKRAYEGFMFRIYEVFASNLALASVMISVLESYLMGDASAADSLTPELRPAWAFLKQDVDLAMERSRRARLRARQRADRRAMMTSQTAAEGDAATDTGQRARIRGYWDSIDDVISAMADVEAPDAEAVPVKRPLSRRERRARERGLRMLTGGARIVNGRLKSPSR